jgi:hypothetical protein
MMSMLEHESGNSDLMEIHGTPSIESRVTPSAARVTVCLFTIEQETEESLELVAETEDFLSEQSSEEDEGECSSSRMPSRMESKVIGAPSGIMISMVVDIEGRTEKAANSLNANQSTSSGPPSSGPT